MARKKISEEEKKEHARAYHYAHKEERNLISLAGLYLWKYGITYEEKKAILEMQGGRCDICKRDLREAPANYIHLDHNHSTGNVRGVLCARCNMRLSAYEKNTPELFRAYLERYDDLARRDNDRPSDDEGRDSASQI